MWYGAWVGWMDALYCLSQSIFSYKIGGVDIRIFADVSTLKLLHLFGTINFRICILKLVSKPIFCLIEPF